MPAVYLPKLDKLFIRDFIKISLPVIITQLMATLINFSDTLMLSHISEKAISGITIANKVFYVFQMILFGLCNGIGLFVSQYYGAKLKDKYNETLRFGIKITLFVSLLVTIVVLAFPIQIIKIFINDPETISYAYKYLSILKYSFIPFGISQIIGTIYKILGLTKVPMYIGILSFISNIVLNYFLIFGVGIFPKLDIAGAAIATVIVRTIEGLIYLLVINSTYSEFSFKEEYEPLNIKQKKEILATSLPLIFNEFIWSMGLNLIIVNYAYVNESLLPAITIVDNINDIANVALSGCASVVGVFVGTKLGEKKLEDAKENSLKFMSLCTFVYVAASLFIFFSAFIAPDLFKLSANTKDAAIFFIKIKALTAWTQWFSNAVYYILRAGGDTKSVLILDGTYTVLGPVLMSVILSRIIKTDIFMMYLIVELLGYFKIILAIYFYRKGKWLKSVS